MITEPALELVAGELAFRLGDRAFAVRPAGLDRVEPRALPGKATNQQAAAAVTLDPTVVVPDPAMDLAADMPSGIVPHQGQHAHALSREGLAHPGQGGGGD